jgi:hypothetical protein
MIKVKLSYIRYLYIFVIYCDIFVICHLCVIYYGIFVIYCDILRIIKQYLCYIMVATIRENGFKTFTKETHEETYEGTG